MERCHNSRPLHHHQCSSYLGQLNRGCCTQKTVNIIQSVVHILCTINADIQQYEYDISAFSALTLLVGRQEGHPACKKYGHGGGGHW